MRHGHDERFISATVIACLAFAPLVRGGGQEWAALLVAAGLVSLLAVAVLRSLWSGAPVFIWKSSDFAFLLALLWAGVGAWRHTAIPYALDACLILFGCLACFLLARAVGGTQGGAMLMARYLCLIAGGIALIGAMQAVGWVPRSWWDPPQFVAATFVNHNHFAALLEVVLPLGVALALSAPLKPRQRFVVVVSCVMMAAGLVMSCSRGAWLSLTLTTVAGLAWAGFIRRKTLWSSRRITALSLVAVAAVLGLAMAYPALRERLVSVLDASNDPSYRMRQLIWQGSWELAKVHPVIGHGLGSFGFEFPRYRPVGLYLLANAAHNDYLQLVTDLGLVGLGLAAWMALLILGRIVRLIRLSFTAWKRALGIGGLIGLSSVAVHSVVDFPWQIPGVALTCAAVAGLLTGITYYADASSPRRLVAGSGVRAARWLRWTVTPILLTGLIAIVRLAAPLIVADVFAAQGLAQRQAGRIEQAIASYERAVRHAPLHAVYHRELGDSLAHRAWRRQGRERLASLRQAAEAYLKALTLAPREAGSAYALGHVFIASGESAQADRWLKQAVDLDPQNPLYWKDWAELKLIQGQAEEAAEAFERAAGLADHADFFPSVFGELTDPHHFVRRGESAWLLGRLTIARTAFAVAARLEPGHPDAQVGLALCAMSRGDMEQATRMMRSIREPRLESKWFAGSAYHHLQRGKPDRARQALETSLRFDASNILAQHVQLVLAKSDRDDAHYTKLVDTMLSFNNQPPVFVGVDPQDGPTVVWEPERGTYLEGRSSDNAWVLSRNGAIHQPLVVPPGRVRFRILARGKPAGGVGPLLMLSWNGRPLLVTEVAGEEWMAFDAETEVYPGESLLTVNFVSDFTNLLPHEYRNLKVEKVIASWGPL